MGSKNTALTPSTLSSPEPSWQIMWRGLKVEVFSLKHRPSDRYLDTRQECKTFKSVGSRPCDRLLLVLATRARGTPTTETDGKIEGVVRRLVMGQKLSNISIAR